MAGRSPLGVLSLPPLGGCSWCPNCPQQHDDGALLAPVFLLFFLVFSRARARAARKPAPDKAFRAVLGLSQLRLFPGAIHSYVKK